MKMTFKRILTMTLVIVMLFLATVPVFAAGEVEEEYLSDLRIIYADSVEGAVEVLDDSELEGYKLFNANLNENTGKKGVWLAYKTTTDVEDAITDIAIMQMNGGYNEGNYQEMIKQSYDEYLKFGENYLTAIDHFNKGIDAGHYLSEIAHRQLNFYNVVTEGIEEIPEFEGERLGDIFYDGIDASDLATMFMEGNSYALSNIRSLIAMGVSYNEDGKTYLEHVAIEAEKYTADKTIYDNEDYNGLAGSIASTISTFKAMFKEYEAYESELNYEDEDFTDLEIQYMEYMYVAKLMRGVDYLNGKTLYQFCMDYKINKEDYSEIYPLVAALNEGQVAVTKVNHYYDVVRYSSSIKSSEVLDEELNAAEEKYGDNPFNVYAGVDRSIYRDTFALTSEAYRSNAFTEEGLAAYLGRDELINASMNIMGVAGIAVLSITGAYHISEKVAINRVMDKFYEQGNRYFDANFITNSNNKSVTLTQFLDEIFEEYTIPGYDGVDLSKYAAQQKLDIIGDIINKDPDFFPTFDKEKIFAVKDKWTNIQRHDPVIKSAKEAADSAQEHYAYSTSDLGAFYVIGGLMALASAIRLGIEIYNYYHPTYDDIPTAMVDLIDTVDGDRYIKYDVVYEAEPKADGTYIAADLNAFQANRWNAMYYTKSYEAGKPLLADEFVVSNTSNVPADKHMPVHRFGEVVCYNLNKYNFNDDHSIFLSVKQSDNQKSAVADVPAVVGSVFSAGYMILAGGIGIAAGVGGTIGTMEIIKRRKSKSQVDPEAEPTAE